MENFIFNSEHGGSKDGINIYLYLKSTYGKSFLDKICYTYDGTNPNEKSNSVMVDENVTTISKNIKNLEKLQKAPSDLKSGKYNICIDMRKYGKESEQSMGNGALTHKAILWVDKDANKYLDINLHKLENGIITGRLTNLWYYDVLTDGRIDINNEEKLGKMNPTKILKYTEGQDLLGEKRNFPTNHRIYFNTFENDPRRYIRVRVDAMDLIDLGAGKDPYIEGYMGFSQVAIICLDYRTLERIGDIEEPVKPEPKPKLKPSKPSRHRGGSSSVVATTETKASERVSGSDRYETAIKIAKESYPNAKNAMLGSGEIVIDALSAGAVTKSIKAPILLTGKNILNPGTKKVIEEYKLNNLYILGGGNTISDKVQEEVKGI